ncbi:glycosyltransferase family 32 protein [Luteolibacter sp. AS25]|uniref:glycosyltransferase family 32 protein n=1 Tax=Luteolibacter sp. AS25 TaxID=3135776 RepID=UPI00398B0D37
MIPKTIHYIWFGEVAKPKHVLDTVESWHKKLPDYEIIEWNESNFDVTQHPWMKRMYNEGKFAFASDWARLKILEKQGGIYLDTDVEIHKTFETFRKHRMFWGFEYETYLATSTIGSEPNHPFLTSLLALHDHLSEAEINNIITTRHFLETFEEFRLNNSRQVLPEGIEVYPKEYFSVPTKNTEAGFCRHHGTNLWRGGKRSSILKNLVRKVLGEANYFKLVAWKVNRASQFYPVYQKHKTKSNYGNT